jgi:hypothetical protein
MLPRKTSLGLYSDRQYDRIRGFIVLAHAEVEYCLEKLAEDALLRAQSSFQSDGQMRPCLASLIAWIPLRDRPPSWAGWSSARRASWSVRYYLGRVVPNNHGASSRHIASLTTPLGVQQAALDNSWLLLADALSYRRGGFAHTGLSAQTDPNPSDQRRDFRDLDGLLTAAAT